MREEMMRICVHRVHEKKKRYQELARLEDWKVEGYSCYLLYDREG